MTEEAPDVTLETTILDILHRYRGTEAVFKRLEAETGRCVCCEGLFLSLREAAARFGFSAADVLAEVRAASGDAGAQAGRGGVSAAESARPDRPGRLRASPRRASQR